MSESTEYRPPAAPRERGDDDALARLLQMAGPRPEIPADLERRVEARVRAEWRQASRQRRVLRFAVPVALAASLLLAVTIDWQEPATPLLPAIGTVARVNAGTAAGAALPAVGSSVSPGQTVVTGPEQSISLTLRDGTSLRLAPESRLEVEAVDEFRLLDGELYADTGPPVYRSRSLTVHTPVALVTDVGTQFLVRFQGDSLRVAVREGRVDVQQSDDVHTAIAGELLRLAPGGTPDVEAVEPHAALWDWAAAVAPVFEIENRTLMDFLKWAARETGRELVFADSGQRMAAMRTVLHGSISGFAPDEAVNSVLATSGFAYRVTPDSIVIGFAGDPQGGSQTRN